MATGTVSIEVRPLRFAFLVDPHDRAGLRKAIQINSLLWGGADNPIIPAFRRTPKHWAKKGTRTTQPDGLIEAQIEGFDPDYLVAVGKCANRKFSIGHRDQISTAELLGEFSTDMVPAYGIGTLDIINHIIREELRFERREPLKLAIPNIARTHTLFIAAVIGELPKEFGEFVRQEYSTFMEPNVECGIENYAAFLGREWLFPRRLTTIELKRRGSGEQFIFLCDALRIEDIIEYWNLRAAGHVVIPVPRQAFHQHNVITMVRNFVDESFGTHRYNPDVHFHANFQLSASIDANEAEAFIDSLQLLPDAKTAKQKYGIYSWHPLHWVSKRSWRSSTERGYSYAYEQDVPVQSEQDRLDLRSFGPKFEISGYSSFPRFANNFAFRFYGATEPIAEVIPAASREMSNAVGRTGYQHWRFSPTGPVFLSHGPRDLIFLDIPKAEIVVKEWLKERHWQAELSVPGKIAKQIITRLGGIWGIPLLTHECLLQLLSELQSSDRGMGRQKIVGYLKKGLKSDWGDPNPEGFLERLVEKGVLRLGAEVQCSVCGRYNWYELDKLGYTLPCRYCLSEFKPPLDSPKTIEWTYRPHGLFAIEDQAQGAYSVLLTLHCLGGDHDCGISPLFSYTAHGEGADFEADLTILYQSSTWNSSEILSVHAECKSYNSFKARDVSRLAKLSAILPGSILVFSTFKAGLGPEEIKILKTLVLQEWRKRSQQKQYSPVIVLTGTELFSQRGIPYCWEGKGDKYEQFTKAHFHRRDLRMLAEATQCLYLGLGTYYSWAEERAKKRANRPKQNLMGVPNADVS